MSFGGVAPALLLAVVRADAQLPRRRARAAHANGCATPLGAGGAWDAARSRRRVRAEGMIFLATGHDFGCPANNSYPMTPTQTQKNRRLRDVAYFEELLRANPALPCPERPTPANLSAIDEWKSAIRCYDDARVNLGIKTGLEIQRENSILPDGFLAGYKFNFHEFYQTNAKRHIPKAAAIGIRA